MLTVGLLWQFDDILRFKQLDKTISFLKQTFIYLIDVTNVRSNYAYDIKKCMKYPKCDTRCNI